MAGLIAEQASAFLAMPRVMTTLVTSNFVTLNGSVVATTTNLATPEALATKTTMGSAATITMFPLILSWHLILVCKNSLLYDLQDKKNNEELVTQILS